MNTTPYVGRWVAVLDDYDLAVSETIRKPAVEGLVDGGGLEALRRISLLLLASVGKKRGIDDDEAGVGLVVLQAVGHQRN